MAAEPAHKVVPWLGITGTNGKTTTTQMLDSILSAAGLRSAAVGNIGRPIMEIVLDPEPYDVLAVELSSHQLHWSNPWPCTRRLSSPPARPLGMAWQLRGLPGGESQDLRGVQASCVYNVASRHRAAGRGGGGGRRG